MAVELNLIPKTMTMKKILKRMVFGKLVEMPVEIGPQITQNDADLSAKKGPLISRNEEKKENDPQITQITQNGKLYRGRYVEPNRRVIR